MNLTMRSVNCHSSFLPLHSQFKQNELRASKMVWLSRNETNNKLLDRQWNSSQPPLRTKAISTSLILGITSPTQPDVGVFLQTSAVLFFAYWISNFVVPDIVSKHLQLEPTSDDPKDKDNATMKDEKAEKPLSSTNMLPKKRGFNSSKPK